MSQVEHHQTGIEYWRSLEQLADTPEVRELMSKEFPGYDASQIAATSRRRFLKLMGASMALAGLTLTGCRRWPEEKLAPYTTPPQGRVPGVPEQYATVWEVGGVSRGLLATSFDGRPIKIEGNPSHPANWVVKGKYGSADAYDQASILELYDPDRSKGLVDRTSGKGEESTWEHFAAFARKHFGGMQGNGAGFAVLSEESSSPSVLDMKARLLKAYPQAKWYEYEPLHRDNESEGARAAFGKPLRSVLKLDQATVVVSLDADLLGTHPAHTRYAADWAVMRRSGDQGKMNRVYMAESTFSITGAVADVRLPVSPARVHAIARAIAALVGVAGVSGDEKLTKEETQFVHAAAADLKAAGGSGVVVAGPSAPVAAHVLAHAINAQLGAVGKSVVLIDDPAGDRPAQWKAIADLTKAMLDGNVGTLLILGGNPVYNAPADLDFEKALGKVLVSIHLSLYNDETSRACKWHLPRSHYLEAWGDGRSWDGTAGIGQPLIEPLFGGKSFIEALAIVTADQVAAGEQIVRRTWKEQFIKSGDFETQWRRALEAGVLAETAGKPVAAKLTATQFAASEPVKGMCVRFLADSHAYDGRFANNGWLQELHDPITKLVWDNAAWVSVHDAKQMGLTTGDVVKVETPERWMELAVFVAPGQPVGVIGLPLGYGRRSAGRVGDKLGFNTYSVRTASAPYYVGDVKVSKTGHTYTLATTQAHFLMDELGMRGIDERVGDKGETGVIVREATLAEFTKSKRAPHQREPHISLTQLFNPPSQFNKPHAWGMAVDMNTCIGCNACVVACQAENNIPIVGKDQVLMHRQMHWIRIDRYFKGAAEDSALDVVFQPMMCVHCENAPCEQVCPVAATVHDTEGLNTMVYNRCIGTRYCSNNCPYKVRRFNYFDFHSKDPKQKWAAPWPGMPDTQQREEVDKLRRLQFNPEVTVRMRGVMEKCTYCTQRLSRAKVDKRNAGQELKDGDVMTACQQACPTQAITFGNLNEKDAAVSQLHRNPRAFDVLGELNTRPRTKYLAKLRNPAPQAGAAAAAEHHSSASGLMGIENSAETIG